jgi:RNA polymerase sigma-70 factor (ECF subfamily)
MDAESFKKEFIPYHQKLYRIAYRMLQDSEMAQDIVQDTYIKLWEKRDEMKDIQNTESFAVVVLRNLCLDFLRKPKQETYAEYNIEMAEPLSLSDQMDTAEKLNRVEQIIQHLPEQQRLVMIYKHWDDYSDKEIEDIMGLSAVNIRVILSRARKTVREQFIKLQGYES